MITKPCVKCGATDRKPNGDCRPCAKACNAAWWKANPNYTAARYKANPEKGRVASAKWRKANPNYKAEYYVAHPEQEKARVIAWRAAHPEMVKASVAAWGKANPEKVKAKSHKRRAIKLATGGTFTAEDIKKMLKQQKGKCVVCKVGITKFYHIDHIMPLARGGHNGISNIQLLCPTCNLTKSAKHPVDWMQERGYLL